MKRVIARTAHSRRVILRSLAAACLTASAIVAVWPAPAQAESPDSTGWWNKLKPVLPPDAGNPIPPPPDVPAEGLLVANDPSGAQAFVALRFEATRARQAVLTLHAPGDEPVPPTAAMVACPVLSDWDQVFDGPWERRPDVDCLTIAAPGEISDDGLTVTWPINEEYFRLGVLVNKIEIAVLPDPASAVPFRAVFERPGFDALVADGPLIEPAGVDGGEGGAIVPPPELPTAIDAPPLSGGAGVLPPDGSFGSDAGLPPSDVAGDGSAPGGSGATTPIESAASLAAPGSTSDRMMAAALLALTAAGLFLASGRHAPRPKLIGGLAHRADAPGSAAQPDEWSDSDQDPTGGVGRFRRVRSGAPVS
jgi:hypothetical protein